MSWHTGAGARTGNGRWPERTSEAQIGEVLERHYQGGETDESGLNSPPSKTRDQRNRNQKRENRHMATADPWAAPDTDAPERERAERNADLPDFFKMSDLVGRHVLIKPETIETVPDGKFGPYDKITAEVVIVLDGRKNELFPVLPRIQRNMWIFDGNIVSELRAFLNPKDEHRFGKAALGYVTVNDRKKLIMEDGTSDPEVAKKARDAWKLYESGETVPQQAEPPF